MVPTLKIGNTISCIPKKDLKAYLDKGYHFKLMTNPTQTIQKEKDKYMYTVISQNYHEPINNAWTGCSFTVTKVPKKLSFKAL